MYVIKIKLIRQGVEDEASFPGIYTSSDRIKCHNRLSKENTESRPYLDFLNHAVMKHPSGVAYSSVQKISAPYICIVLISVKN